MGTLQRAKHAGMMARECGRLFRREGRTGEDTARRYWRMLSAHLVRRARGAE